MLEDVVARWSMRACLRYDAVYGTAERERYFLLEVFNVASVKQADRTSMTVYTFVPSFAAQHTDKQAILFK